MNKALRLTGVLAGALLLTIAGGGCSLTGRSSTPPTKVFLLDDLAVSGNPVNGKSWPCLTLRIAAPRAAPGFATRRMAYTRQGEALQYFAWHEWADTPARLLAVLTEQRLDSLGMFGNVLSGASDVATDLRLDLEQVLLLQTVQDSQSRVTLSAKVQLVEVTARRVLGSRRLRVDEPAAAANPLAGVAAAQRAATELLDTMTLFVSDTVPATDCAYVTP